MELMCYRYLTDCRSDRPYLGDTLRYLILCSTYNVHTVYIGEYPYAEELLPEFPAAFSYRPDRRDPSTIRELLRYLPHDATVRSNVRAMFRDGWSMLPMGVAMINVDYISGGRMEDEE
ncbi:unnamed protein product, partial [Scytosiphon promiscuus]